MARYTPLMRTSIRCDHGRGDRIPRSADRATRHRVVEVGELTASEIARWLELRESNPALDEPILPSRVRPRGGRDATRCAGDHRGGSTGEIDVVLPVQFDRRICRPAGAPAADFQGPICGPNIDFDIEAALRAARSLPIRVRSHARRSSRARAVDRSAASSPPTWTSRAASTVISRARRAVARTRSPRPGGFITRLEREHGPVRFVAHSADAALLDNLIAMKRRQYSETGARDYFADP